MTFRTSPNTDRGRRWRAVDEITGKPTPFVVDGRRTSAARHDTTMAHRACGRSTRPTTTCAFIRHQDDNGIQPSTIGAALPGGTSLTISGFGAPTSTPASWFHLTAEGGGFTVLGGSPTQNSISLSASGIKKGSVSSTGLRWRPAAATTARLANDRTITGYYGAYLLDPDANTIEAVFHDRTLTSTIATNQTATTIELVNHNR
jgi:hypothetical protein